MFKFRHPFMNDFNITTHTGENHESFAGLTHLGTEPARYLELLRSVRSYQPKNVGGSWRTLVFTSSCWERKTLVSQMALNPKS